jgi:hypothetical protein
LVYACKNEKLSHATFLHTIAQKKTKIKQKSKYVAIKTFAITKTNTLNYHPPIRTGPAWWVMVRSPYVLLSFFILIIIININLLQSTAGHMPLRYRVREIAHRNHN